MTVTSVKRLRLFLEGIECPISSANVTANIDGSAAATISIIATPEMLNIPVRTCVHVFFLEDIAISLDSEYSEGLDLAIDKRYRLLFCGEVHKISYNKNASGGISGSLECFDHYENYSRARIYYETTTSATSGDTGEATASSQLYSGILKKENYISFQGSQTIVEALSNPNPLTRGYKKIEGLQGSIIHIIERFTGFIQENKDGTFGIDTAGYSMFQTLQQLRLKILQQIGIYSLDTFAKDLVSSDFLKRFLENQFKIEGGLLSVSEIIDMILETIYYKRVSNPCGFPYVISDDQEPTLNQSSKSIRLYLNRLDQEIKKNAPPPASAVTTPYLLALDKNRFPIEWFGFGSKDSFDRVINSKDIRVWAKEISLARGPLAGCLNILIESLQNAQQQEIDFRLKNLTDLFTQINNRGSSIGDLIVNLKKNPGPYLELVSDIPRTLYANDKAVYAGKIMNTTMLLPELFWSVPPTCNMIYPNMYETLQFTKDAANETTRLTLQATNKFLGNTQGSVANRLYFAPSIFPIENVLQNKGVITQDTVQKFIATNEQGKNEKSFNGYLLDHELFSGIVPEFTTRDVFKFMGVRNIKDQDEFLGRSADYFYIQSRLSKNSISLTGIFNPYVAVGFPCVIFDRYSSTETGSEFLGSVSNHYIGYVSLVSHSVDQGSATTSYSISYVRRHRDTNLTLGKIGDLNEPLESSIEPLWLDRVYRSDQIGKVYQELLGVQSVVDDTSIEKKYFKKEDNLPYSSLQDAIDSIEKKLITYRLDSQESLSEFTRNSIYRELPTLEFVLTEGISAFHNFDLNNTISQYQFSTCPINYTAPISTQPHSSYSPSDPGASVQNLRKELILAYVESTKLRGVPI